MTKDKAAASPQLVRANHMIAHRTSSNTRGGDFTNSFGNETHEPLPSCSYKLETDENSCDSGISVGSSSSASSANELITDFSSFNKSNGVEVDGFVMVDKPELSDEELETERRLLKHIEDQATYSTNRFGLSDMTNMIKNIPGQSNGLFLNIRRKRSAEVWDNFERQKKSNLLSPAKSDSSSVELKEHFQPKRCLLRRSQSVIETYTDSASTSGFLQDIDDVGHAFQQIGGCTLVEWMEAPDFYERYYLVDCRYPYEYNGGHIKGAINCWDPDSLHKIFYPVIEEEYAKMRSKIPIFYCEFSVTRGPRMAKRLRSYDRHRNVENYPELDYREIYVLQNGYREFFSVESRKEYCEPCEYVKMRHSNHVDDLKRFSFHKSKSFSCTSSVFKKNSRPMKSVRFRDHHQSESSSLSQRSLPTIPTDFFNEKLEDLIALDDLAESFFLEAQHFSKLRMTSPSPRSLLNRPPTRRAVFPPTIKEACIVEKEISVVGLISSQPISPIVEMNSPEFANSAHKHDDSNMSFAEKDNSPCPRISNMPLPIPKFS